MRFWLFFLCSCFSISSKIRINQCQNSFTFTLRVLFIFVVKKSVSIRETCARAGGYPRSHFQRNAQVRFSILSKIGTFLYFFRREYELLYFFVNFTPLFTPFFGQLARFVEPNRQYWPKNEHHPQKSPKISPNFPQFLKNPENLKRRLFVWDFYAAGVNGCEIFEVYYRVFV